MTIGDAAGPVLLEVLPTAVAVLLATLVAASMPVLLPRFVVWLKGPEAPRTAPGDAARSAGQAAAEQEQTWSL